MKLCSGQATHYFKTVGLQSRSEALFELLLEVLGPFRG